MERKMTAYALLINVRKDMTIKIGSFGLRHFAKGKYVYAGSARKGFDARIRRHLSKTKRLHWHADYLLFSKVVFIEKVIAFGDYVKECDIISALISSGCGKIWIKGFGSSDCRCGCPAHLLGVDGSAIKIMTGIGGKFHR